MAKTKERSKDTRDKIVHLHIVLHSLVKKGPLLEQSLKNGRS